MSDILIFVAIYTILIMAGLFFWKQKKRSGPTSDMKIVKFEKKKNKYYQLYKLFNTVPGIRNEFAKVKESVRLIYPTDQITINEESVKLMMKPFGLFVGISIFSFIINEGEFYPVILGIFIAYIVFRGMIDKRLATVEQRLLRQFSDFLSSLISVYSEEDGKLDDAIYSMIDTLPTLMALHASKFYDVITSQHLDEAASEYKEVAPNNFFMGFISLAVPTKHFGDTKLPDGNTTFIKGLMNLKKQTDEQILKLGKIDRAFSSLSTIATIPVFTIKPLQMYFSFFMPQTASFYEGPLGTVTLTVVFISAYFCYNMISSLKSTRKKEIIENSIWLRALKKFPGLNSALNIQYRKYYTKWQRIEKKMIATGDKTGVKAHIVKCMAYAVAGFLIVNVLFLVGDFSAAKESISNFENTFQNTVVPDDSYTSSMENVSKEIVKSHLKDDSLNDNEIKKEIIQKDPKLNTDTYITAVTSAVHKSYSKYNSIYFKWYFEIIALLMGAIAFNVPTWLLNFDTKAMEMEKEDEVNSFNLLAMIFMDMESIKISDLLEWMERFSYNYQNDISECIVNYEMGQNKALDKLMESDNLPGFQKFVRCMKNVDKIGMKEAFKDIEIQQDYYNKKREDEDLELIQRKSRMAKTISYVPAVEEVILWVLLPMIMYAANLVISLQSSLGGQL